MPSRRRGRADVKLTSERRRALKLLASNPRGCTEALMLAHGFPAEMLAKLVLAGLATAEPQTVRAGQRAMKVTQMRITDAGRQAL